MTAQPSGWDHWHCHYRVLGLLSRFSDSLRAGRSGDRIPVAAIFSAPVQTVRASYTIGIGSFPGVKRPGCGVDHPPPSIAKAKERVGLYIYSPSGPSWSVLGWTLPFITWCHYTHWKPGTLCSFCFIKIWSFLSCSHTWCHKQCLSLLLAVYFSPVFFCLSDVKHFSALYLNSLNSQHIKIQSLWPLKHREHEVNTVVWGKLTGFCCSTGFGIQSTGIVRCIAVSCSLVLGIQTISSEIKTGFLKGSCLQKEPWNIFPSHLFCVTRENQFKYNIFMNFYFFLYRNLCLYRRKDKHFLVSAVLCKHWTFLVRQRKE